MKEIAHIAQDGPPKLSMFRQFVDALRRVPVIRFLVRKLHPPTTLEINGITFRLHPSDNVTDYMMWRDRQFAERESVEAIIDLVKGKRALFIDIGSNSGLYALAVAHVVGSDATVLACEPNPLMANRIRDNIKLNTGMVEVALHEVALSDSSGRAMLTFARGNYGEASLSYTNRPDGHIDVETTTLADLIPAQVSDYEVFVIKLDVEGHEDRVLCNFLGSAPDDHLPDYVLIEVSNSGHWEHDLFSAFEQREYTRLSHAVYGNGLFTRQHRSGAAA